MSLSDVQEFRRKLPGWQSFSLDFVLGGVIGGVSHTVVAPIERVKLILQTQDSNIAMLGGHHRRYRGFVDTVSTIVREEGVWALWRGNGTGVLRYYPSVALNFAFKDYYRALLAPSTPATSPARIAAGNFLAGAGAGATSLAFTYPLDLAHTRLATDVGSGGARRFKGMRSVLAATYAKEGWRGLYRGFPASVHGILVHRSVYFGGFDSAKQLLLQDNKGSGSEAAPKRSSFWIRWLLAQAATSAASILAYPFDTVRHRMMMQVGLRPPPPPLTGSGVGVHASGRHSGSNSVAVGSGSSGEVASASLSNTNATATATVAKVARQCEGVMYKGTWDCWKTILLREGVRGFYKGIFSNLLRGTGAAFVLVMYDEFKHIMHGHSY